MMVDPDEDVFAFHARRTAASARQLFRASAANDSQAVAVSLFYFSDNLVKVLARHLTLPRHVAPGSQWNVVAWRLVSLASLDVDVELPRRIRIRGAVVCKLSINPIAFALGLPPEATDRTRVWDLSDYPFGTQWQEPFEFELRLHPHTGAFQGYQFRLGDHRPFGEKRIEPEAHSAVRIFPPSHHTDQQGGWLVEVNQGEFLGAEALSAHSSTMPRRDNMPGQMVDGEKWGDLYLKAWRDWESQQDGSSGHEPNRSAGPGTDEDKFVVSDQWLAAEARQLMRAHNAGDSEAIEEVAWFYFEDYLTNTLRRHLQQQDPIWDGRARWFDGLSAEPEFLSPGHLRLRGQVAWVISQERGCYDPLDFELQLCPTTGAFRKYVLRFGDHRPLAAKVFGSAKAGVPVGRWAFEFERRSAESGSVT